MSQKFPIKVGRRQAKLLRSLGALDPILAARLRRVLADIRAAIERSNRTSRRDRED